MDYRDRIRQTLHSCATLDPADLKRFQHRLLERLCRHAALHTEGYRKSAGAMFSGADPVNGDWLPEKWAEIPMLERTRMVAAPDEFQSSSIAEDQYESGETSGSTSEPLRYRKSVISNAASIGVAERAFARFGLDFSATFADIRVVLPSGKRSPDARRWNSRQESGEHRIFEIRRPVEEQWVWLKNVQPDYLLSYPSNLRSLARLAMKEPNAIWLKACVASAEVLPDDVRDLVGSTFGVETLGLYGLRELGHVATGCPESGQLHIAADVTMVEIIDDDGKPAGPGETGQIIATSLYNHAMPFIRYATGDYAEVGEPCACGWTLPTLRRVLGRRRNRFALPDGREVWPGLFFSGLENELDIDDFQLEQVTSDQFRFSYVRALNRPDLEDEAVCRRISSAFDRPVAVQVTRTDRIKPSGYAKQERFISHVPQTGA